MFRKTFPLHVHCNNNLNWPQKWNQNSIILQKLLKEIGCTTPFELDRSQVCTNATKGKMAINLRNKYSLNHTCLYPCQYLSDFSFTTAEGGNWFLFSEFCQVHETRLTYTELDLLAALGGYIGLFLGVSLFHLRDGIVFLIRKIIH